MHLSINPTASLAVFVCQDRVCRTDALSPCSEELGRQREAVRQLQEELNSVKKGLLTLHAAMWRSQQHERAQHAQQQQQAAPVSEASHSHAPAPSYNVPTPAQQSSMQHHNAHHQPMQPVSREP